MRWGVSYCWTLQASVDLDGDGLLDLIVPSGNSTQGLLFFQQNALGQFEKRPGWNPLSAADQEDIWAVACGDYDGDGQIDVYLCRCGVDEGELPGPNSTALPDFLLKNDLVESNTFVDATYELEVVYDTETPPQPIHWASIAAEWFDYVDEGRAPFLVVADTATLKGLIFYRNMNEDVTPRLDMVSSFNTLDTAGISDIAITDLDNDSYAEVTAMKHGSTQLHHYVYNDLIAGSGISESTISLSRDLAEDSCIRVLDYDLDGDQDILTFPKHDAGSPELHRNDGDPLVNGLIKVTGLGLSSLRGATNGGLVTSLNGNGLSDIFFGRRQETKSFLAIGREAAPGSASWVGVRLLESEEMPVPVNQAVVEFSNGLRWEVGGSGRADYVLNIGDAGQEVTCNVYWPSGHVTENVVLNCTPPAVTTVYHQDGFDNNLYIIDDNTMTVNAKVMPDCKITYTFYWKTSIQTFLEDDSVTFNGNTVLEAGYPDVSVRQWEGPLVPGSPAITVFHHELIWSSQPCVVGTHTYQVHGSRGGAVKSSDTESFRVKVCPSQTPVSPSSPPEGGQL